MQTPHYIAELSKCVSCGSCKAQCPTYDNELTESMSARGRLALLNGFLTQQLDLSPLLEERIYSCILCGACETFCPPNVDITGAIYYGRRLLKNSGGRRRFLRMLVNIFIQKPMLSFRLAKLSQQLGLSPRKISGFLGQPFNLTLPDAPLISSRQAYRPGKKTGRVAIFTGCSINFLLPHLGVSLINVLMRLGYEVILPKGEVCCGIPLRGLGMEDEAVKLAEKNYRTFSRLKVDAILSLCPTCILALNMHYPKMIGRGLNVLDISTFLHDKLESIPLRGTSNFTTVTYHDPCHLSYSLGIKKEPRKLIKLTGAELYEAEGEGCCGFGGTFSLQYKDLSVNLLQKRIDAYTDTGADSLVTSCPGCILQLGRAWDNKKVFHLIELIEQAVC